MGSITNKTHTNTQALFSSFPVLRLFAHSVNHLLAFPGTYSYLPQPHLFLYFTKESTDASFLLNMPQESPKHRHMTMHGTAENGRRKSRPAVGS